MNPRYSAEMKGGSISWSNAALLALLFAAVFSAFALLTYLPFPELESFLSRETSTRFYDRRGELIAVLPLEDGLKREYVPLEELPPQVIELFIRSEDRRFYRHPGIDPAALARALLQYLSAGRVVSGGSTVTMQLARMVVPGRGRVRDKVGEMFRALRIEQRLSKDEIVELYLNNLPFGFQVEGIASAARFFFGVPVQLVLPEEAAVLAVLPRSPDTYNPFIRKDEVLSGAERIGSLLSPPLQREAIAAVLEKVEPGALPNEAPHFIEYILSRHPAAPQDLDYAVDTSLDLHLNRMVSERINYYLDRYREFRLFNGAAMVLDNATGELLAYVGTHDFADIHHAGQIDGVQVTNQPGSSLKPFLYALAVERGFRPNTIVPDEPMDFGGEEVYVPMNFDNRYHGPVRLRVALASSLNVPAAYTLMQVSVKRFTDFLLSLGFESLENQKESVGIGLALGNAEVSLFELVRGFSLFPSRGRLLPVAWQRQEEEGGSGEGEQILSPYTADIITHILSDRSSRTLAFGSGEVFATDFPAMFKTGTANQHQNIWALGATPRYTVGVWMGNHSGNTVIGKTGSSLPLLAVRDILTRLQRTPASFPLPEGAEGVQLCTRSGERAIPECPATYTEYLPRGETPSFCTLHAGSVRRTAVRGLRIRKPGNNALFYVDPQADPSHQVVVVEAEGGAAGDRADVYLNSRLWRTIEHPFRFQIPLERGTWQVRVQAESGSDQVSFTVR